MRRSLTPKLTAKRVAGLRAVRSVADLMLSTGECSDEMSRELEDGIDWIDQLLTLRGPKTRPERAPIRVLVIKEGR